MQDFLGRSLGLYEVVLVLSASHKLEYAVIIAMHKSCPVVRRFNPDGTIRTYQTVIRGPERLAKTSAPAEFLLAVENLRNG